MARAGTAKRRVPGGDGQMAVSGGGTAKRRCPGTVKECPGTVGLAQVERLLACSVASERAVAARASLRFSSVL